MMAATPTITQLADVISQVTAPAFLLAAQSEFLAVLVSRLDRIMDRLRMIDSVPDEDRERGFMKAELPVSSQRAVFTHHAIYWTVASSLVTCVLVIIGFISAFLHVRHEYGAATFFVISLGLFTAALICFALEVKLLFSEIKRPARGLR